MLKSKLLIILLGLFIATECYAADRYWVGGGSSANWNATGNTNWGTASGTQDNASVPGAADDVIFDNHANGNTPCTLTASTTINSLVMTGWANTLTHNSSVTLTIDNVDGSSNKLVFSVGMTYTPVSTSSLSRISFTGVAGNITMGGQTINALDITTTSGTNTFTDNIILNGTGGSGSSATLRRTAGTVDFTTNTTTVTLTGAKPDLSIVATFYNLYHTGTASVDGYLRFEASPTISNEFKVNGNSALNRILVTSITLGTPQTLTLTGATISGCTNVDFRDITFANGGANVDFSAITGGSGDCGGNAISGGGTLSFTTADDWYWNGSGTRNFSDYTYWYTATNGGGSQMGATRCPLPQDTCYFDADSIDGATTVARDLPRVGTIDCAGSSAFTLNRPINTEVYGGFIVGGISTLGYTNYIATTYSGRGSYLLDYTSKSPGRTVFNSISGTYSLSGNFSDSTSDSSYSMTWASGTFDAVSYNITSYYLIGSGAISRTIYMGSGIWRVSMNASVTAWSWATTTNLNFDAEQSTVWINPSFSTVNTYTFAGGNLAYNNLTIGGGTYNQASTTIITGSNTFNTFTINAPKTVKFTSGTTQIVNELVATGSAGNQITLAAVTTDVIATISDANGGTNVNDYLDVVDIVANEANTFYYGANGSADAESLNWLESPTTGIAPQRMMMGVGK